MKTGRVEHQPDRNRLSQWTRGNGLVLIVAGVGLCGTAYAAAALPKNSVGTKQLKKNAVNGSKVKDNSLTGADINASTLAPCPMRPMPLAPTMRPMQITRATPERQSTWRPARLGLSAESLGELLRRKCDREREHQWQREL